VHSVIVSNPATAEARSQQVEEYFRFARWLASKPDFRPVTKALLLYQVVEFFGLKACSDIQSLDQVGSCFVIVSHDRNKCFVVDDRGAVRYAHCINGRVGETIESWK
jgi:hypothetical protein